MNLLKKLFGGKEEQVVRYTGENKATLPPAPECTMNDLHACVGSVLKELTVISDKVTEAITKLDTIAKQADLHYRVARGGERYKNLVDENQEKS